MGRELVEGGFPLPHPSLCPSAHLRPPVGTPHSSLRPSGPLLPPSPPSSFPRAARQPTERPHCARSAFRVTPPAPGVEDLALDRCSEELGYSTVESGSVKEGSGGRAESMWRGLPLPTPALCRSQGRGAKEGGWRRHLPESPMRCDASFLPLLALPSQTNRTKDKK
jgi:hypothetical protein